MKTYRRDIEECLTDLPPGAETLREVCCVTSHDIYTSRRARCHSAEKLTASFIRLTMMRGAVCIFLSILCVGIAEGNPRTGSVVLSLTGGSTDLPPKKKKKRKKHTEKNAAEEKKVIQEAMREKDAAAALGDAIRERAHVLRSDQENPLLQKIDQSVTSVGYAMGTSDQEMEEREDGGGVEAAPTSVLANYFLKSHGGAHAVQCACSLLATVSAMGALLVPTSPLRVMLIKRSMLFAMTKHVSGLLAATSMTATAIPEVGLRKARVWVKKLAQDPVSQYIFYSALILIWLPSSQKAWWLESPLMSRLAPGVLLGPILLREATSTAFVISDILILLTTSGGRANAPRILQIGQSLHDAFMSVLVTPSVWKTANAQHRQEILAKLASRTSLILELCVGLLLSMDAIMSLWEFSFQPARPPFAHVLKRLFCARLYLNFLWVRRRKIVKLGSQLRGGAAQFPFRVLDVILDPKSSMGLEVEQHDPKTWMDYAIMALGLDE